MSQTSEKFTIENRRRIFGISRIYWRNAWLGNWVRVNKRRYSWIHKLKFEDRSKISNEEMDDMMILEKNQVF
jgi:hypothetical protein